MRPSVAMPNPRFVDLLDERPQIGLLAKPWALVVERPEPKYASLAPPT